MGCLPTIDEYSVHTSDIFNDDVAIGFIVVNAGMLVGYGFYINSSLFNSKIDTLSPTDDQTVLVESIQSKVEIIIGGFEKWC